MCVCVCACVRVCVWACVCVRVRVCARSQPRYNQGPNALIKAPQGLLPPGVAAQTCELERPRVLGHAEVTKCVLQHVQEKPRASRLNVVTAS